MKLSLKIILPLVLIGGSTLFGMSINPKRIYVKNNLNRRLKVIWSDHLNKDFSKVLAEGETAELGRFDHIADNKDIRFEAYGKVIGWTAQPTKTKKDGLQAEFQKLAPSADDSLVLTVSQGYGVYWLSLTYSIYKPAEPLAELDNPLLEFPLLIRDPELAKLTEDDILKLGKWDTPVIKAGLLTGETRAEHVYRYILDLTPQYTEDEVKQTYKTLALKWHPDKGTHGMDEAYASRVFNLIKLAHGQLLIALEEKAAK